MGETSPDAPYSTDFWGEKSLSISGRAKITVPSQRELLSQGLGKVN